MQVAIECQIADLALVGATLLEQVLQEVEVQTRSRDPLGSMWLLLRFLRFLCRLLRSRFRCEHLGPASLAVGVVLGASGRVLQHFRHHVQIAEGDGRATLVWMVNFRQGVESPQNCAWLCTSVAAKELVEAQLQHLGEGKACRR